jgi:hypothetical protein
MPNTLIPIQTYTLGSTTASVTFSNIPQNYTDLKLVVSFRGTTAQVYDITVLRFNGLSTNLSSRSIEGNGSAAATFTNTHIYLGAGNGASSTANTFSNIEAYIPNYTSGNQKTVSIDAVGETNGTTIYMQLTTGLWTGTDAITSVEIVPTGSFVANSTFTLYGISNGVKATGGTLTVAGGYAYHTFTSTGSFLPSQKITGAEILVIAGGGAGGGNRGGAGGGAGGLLNAVAQTLNAGNSYTALIGAGGTGASGASGSSGSDSQFGGLALVKGGGRGGSGQDAGALVTGATGGSGGGGGGWGAANAGGSGTSGQGFDGGTAATAPNYPSGGGGGSGAVGATLTGSATTGGAGGVGLSTYSSWGSVTGTGQLVGGVYYYAGGGGGGGNPNATLGGQGGLGGGGVGGANTVSGTSATANTGGGGGGSGLITTGSGGSGGSGIVIIRYPLS